jgi:1-acyl-sn-glycerol-3-phosphate acyltransferase
MIWFKYIFGSIRALIAILSFPIIAIGFPIGKLFGLDKSTIAAKVRNTWIELFVFICGIRINLKAKPPGIKGIYVGNHSAFIDPVIICRYVVSSPMSKAEVKNYPIIGWGAELTGIIWVKRDEKSSRYLAKQAMEEAVTNGTSVVLFPEGTTSTPTSMLPFKDGAFDVASRTGVPIVPLFIKYENKSDFWRRGQAFLNHGFMMLGKPLTKVEITFGEPMYSDNSEELKEKAFDWIEKKKKEAYQQ